MVSPSEIALLRHTGGPLGLAVLALALVLAWTLVGALLGGPGRPGGPSDESSE